MATSHLGEAIRCLRQALLRGDEASLTDGQLLAWFINQRDEAAVATLVRRHGPMVWGVCRRLLPGHHDAEDAFQATFLVLVRKAASIKPREMVANWLHGVARQTALKARATVAKRRVRERQVAEMPEPGAVQQDLWPDLRPLLDQELSRLPDKYRAVVILCDLEGKTRKEAAQQLGCPEGTVAGRLARARAMLAKRLARRGVVLSVGALAAVLSQKAVSAPVPASVVDSAITATTLLAAGQAAATGGISARVAALVEGVVKAMLLGQFRAVAVLLLLGVAGLGAGLLAFRAVAAEQPSLQGSKTPESETRASQEEPGMAPKEDRRDEALQQGIDRVLKAYGGEGKLRQLKAFTLKTKHTEAFGSTSTSEYFVQLPDKLRTVTEREKDGKKETLVFVLNGKEQWKTQDGVAVESGRAEHPPEYWQDFARFLGPRAVLRLKDPQCRVRLLPDGGEVGGHPAVGLGVHKGPMSRDLSLFLYFDRRTGLLLKEENNADDTEIVYEDYKTIDGFPIARKMTRSVKTRRVESQVTGKSEVVEFQVKDELDPKLFQKP
jgi:RNA polymerase sigma factor (sigma-70 family)